MYNFKCVYCHIGSLDTCPVVDIPWGEEVNFKCPYCTYTDICIGYTVTDKKAKVLMKPV